MEHLQDTGVAYRRPDHFPLPAPRPEAGWNLAPLPRDVFDDG